MSELPPPYSPPPLPLPDFNLPVSPGDPTLRPARMASMMLFVLSGFCLIFSAISFLASTVPIEQAPPQQREQIQRLADQVKLPPRTMFLIWGWTMLIPGAFLATLGFFVRGGRLWAVTTAMVVDGLMMLFVIVSIFHALLMHEPAGIVGICPPVGLGLALMWLTGQLWRAAKTARTARAVGQQYQAQFWFGTDNEYGYRKSPPTREK